MLDAVKTRLRQEPIPTREMVVAGICFSGDQWRHNGGLDAVAVMDALTMTSCDLLSSSSFTLTPESTSGGLLWFPWRRGAATSFDGRHGELSLDGHVTTALLGAYWTWGYSTTHDGEAAAVDSTWRVGLLLAHSRGMAATPAQTATPLRQRAR